MNKTISVQINFFGPYVEKREMQRILNQRASKAIYDSKTDLLEQFFDLPSRGLSQAVLERYVEATTKDLNITIAPYNKEINERLLIPLKAAKKHYCLGDYLSTISCCGIVGEMLAILVWRIHETRLGKQAIAEKDEEGLFGHKFERLGQERKLKVLRTLGYINAKQHEMFRKIKEKRNSYLHMWSIDLGNERIDALNTFKVAVRLFKEITGIGASTARANPLLIKLFVNGKQNNKKTEGAQYGVKTPFASSELVINGSTG